MGESSLPPPGPLFASVLRSLITLLLSKPESTERALGLLTSLAKASGHISMNLVPMYRKLAKKFNFKVAVTPGAEAMADLPSQGTTDTTLSQRIVTREEFERARAGAAVGILAAAPALGSVTAAAGLGVAAAAVVPYAIELRQTPRRRRRTPTRLGRRARRHRLRAGRRQHAVLELLELQGEHDRLHPRRVVRAVHVYGRLVARHGAQSNP
eukprot:COSAG06_NODE_3901_length_4790_cov_20.164144_2_plen_211_part_00